MPEGSERDSLARFPCRRSTACSETRSMPGFCGPRSGGGEFPGEHRPLISVPMFDCIQRNNPIYPLRRFVRCGKCGTPLTGSAPKGRNQRYEYYSCRTAGCAANVAVPVLETQFAEFLSLLTPDPAIRELFRRVLMDTW